MWSDMGQLGSGEQLWRSMSAQCVLTYELNMAPDLNSLPASPTLGRTSTSTSTSTAMTGTDHAPSPSAHSPSLSSLQAAAAINAGMRNSNSPRASRRRSSLMTNLHLNDAAVPGPGEMVEPQHHRAPSLGQMHQELENEQEAQVNRLLHMIRQQQDQIDELHADQAPSTNTDDPARPRTLSSSSRQPQRPVSLSRHSSQAVSVTSGPRSSSRSPALRPVASPYDTQREDWLLGGTRDESAFYQAETQTLTRENQMLKQRIRELGESPRSICSHISTDPSMQSVNWHIPMPLPPLTNHLHLTAPPSSLP